MSHCFYSASPTPASARAARRHGEGGRRPPAPPPRRPRRAEARGGGAVAARHLALALAVAAVVSGWWFVRNAAVYGVFDVLASERHDEVVVGQLRWADSGMAGPVAWWYFLSTLFRS